MRQRSMRSLTLVISLALALGGCSAIRTDLASESLFGGAFTTSGLYDKTDFYTVGLLLCRADLVPERVQGVNTTAGNFINVVNAQFPVAAGWGYGIAPRRLSNNTIRIRTYDVQGTSTRVGAEFHVKYRPRAADPSTNIHWVQVYDNNHALSGPSTGHGVRGNRVDVPGTATTPYYDNGYAATSGTCSPACDLYDFPGRGDANRDHNWVATTFLVQGPAVGAGPGQVTFFKPGVRWGWTNNCASIFGYIGSILFSEHAFILSASDRIEPGATVTLVTERPAEFKLSREETSTSVEFEVSFEIEIEKQDIQTGEGGLLQFAVREGSGRLGAFSLGDEESGESSFSIRGGQGFIHPDTGEASLELKLGMESELIPDLVAVGTGQIDPETGALTLHTGFQGVEPDLVKAAAVKMEGGKETQ